MTLVSEKFTVPSMSNKGKYGSHSVIVGAKFKYLNRKYCMDEINVYSEWKHVYDKKKLLECV